MIRWEDFLTPPFLKECGSIVFDSDIKKKDENNWPEPDHVGRLELEIKIVMGNEHIPFTTMDVQISNDPEGRHILYYLVQSQKGIIKLLAILEPESCSEITYI